MDTLRLVLFAAGIIIILAIYIYTRLSSGLPLLPGRKKAEEPELPVPEPPPLTDEDIATTIRSKRYASDVPDDEAIAELSGVISASVSSALDDSELEPISTIQEEESGEPLLVVLNIMAKQGQRLQGLDILDALLSAGFKHGEMNIFHFHDTSLADSRAICSIANSVEPGSFDMQTIEEVSTPGITLFMQLPGPVDGRIAFEQTLKLARQLAESLDAELCDDARSVLTMQTIEHLKEKIEAHRFKARMAQIKQHRH